MLTETEIIPARPLAADRDGYHPPRKLAVLLPLSGTLATAASPVRDAQIAAVEGVLGEIGAQDLPQLLVFNKADALSDERQPLATQDFYEVDGQPVPRIFVSARTGQGLDLLRHALARTVRERLPQSEVPEFDARGLPREYLSADPESPEDFGTM